MDRKEEQLQEVISTLTELSEDATVPKNIKNSINSVIAMLQEDTDISMRISRALHELEEMTSDTNLQPFTRTQLWNITSVLEKLSS